VRIKLQEKKLCRLAAHCEEWIAKDEEDDDNEACDHFITHPSTHPQEHFWFCVIVYFILLFSKVIFVFHSCINIEVFL
jgi:hypothetical protein